MTASNRKTQRSHWYDGDLAKPLPRLRLLVTDDLPEAAPYGLPDCIVSRWDELVAQAQETDSANCKHFFAEFSKKVDLLYDHFGVDRDAPAADLDLAISLARRHEPEFFTTNGDHFSKVLEKHGVDPNCPHACCRLSAKLAQKHVPGFRQIEPTNASRLALNDGEFTSLVLAASEISTKVEQVKGKKPSVRELARILLIPTQLKTYINEQFADEVIRIINASGNLRRNRQDAMCDTTIRTYLYAAETAVQALGTGRINSYHRQYLLGVLPRIHEMKRILSAS